MTGLKAMIKKFEDTGSLEDCQRRGRPKHSVEVVKVVEEDAGKKLTSSVHGECSAYAITQ